MNEKHTTEIRLASGLTMLFGLWLALSPLLITITGAAFWNQLVLGIILFVLGGVQMFTESTLPSWVNGLAGLWLIIAPFSFGLGSDLIWSEVISGAAVALLALYDGFEVAQDQKLIGAS